MLPPRCVSYYGTEGLLHVMTYQHVVPVSAGAETRQEARTRRDTGSNGLPYPSSTLSRNKATVRLFERTIVTDDQGTNVVPNSPSK